MRLKRSAAGGCAAGIASLGLTLLAGPVLAQEDGLLDATVSPDVAAPGLSITASSVDNCPVEPETDHAIVLQVTRHGEGPAVLHEESSTNTNGAWSVTFSAPAEVGDYDLRVWCPGSDFNDYFEQFSVQPAEPTTTTTTTSPSTPTPPPSVPPRSIRPAPVATPVVEQPTFTG